MVGDKNRRYQHFKVDVKGNMDRCGARARQVWQPVYRWGRSVQPASYTRPTSVNEPLPLIRLRHTRVPHQQGEATTTFQDPHPIPSHPNFAPPPPPTFAAYLLHPATPPHLSVLLLRTPPSTHLPLSLFCYIFQQSSSSSMFSFSSPCFSFTAIHASLSFLLSLVFSVQIYASLPHLHPSSSPFTLRLSLLPSWPLPAAKVQYLGLLPYTLSSCYY